MTSSILELAKELTLALVQTGNLAPEDIQETLQKTYTTLTALKAQEESGVFAPAPVSKSVPVDWRKSITKHAVTCLNAVNLSGNCPSVIWGHTGIMAAPTG